MSSLMSNDDNHSSYMNHRIPRKKTASSFTNGDSKSNHDDINSDSIFTAKQPEVAADILSHRIPRKSKDGAPSNNKKRTHDMSSIATTMTKKAPKKVKTTTTPQDNNNDSIPSPVNDNNVPTYQIVKEGRVSGYPIIVSQVGSEHDAILLECKATDNPQDYLNNNKDGKVKIRWKFAGYNGLVPTHTVRLKLVDSAPPIRKAAVLSGLSETGDQLVANKNDGYVDLGDEEDDDAPILKVVRSDLLNSTARSDKDGDYNDQEDRDEKLVCYERSASVGYAGGKSGLAASSTDGYVISSPVVQDKVGGGEGSEETTALANQESNNAEGAYTNFDPQTDEADPNSNKSTPSVVTSQLGIKAENDDADSVATDPINEDAEPFEVKSDINIKTEGEDTDDDELKPSAVTSDMNVKLEGEDTDDELDEPNPLKVTSDMNLKTEEVDTDDEMDAQQVEQVASSIYVKKEKDSAYGDDTDNEEPKPSVVKSDVNVKAEEEDTDDEMNTSSLSHDNLIPTISASTSESEEDNAVVLEFFIKFNSCLEERTLDDDIKEMIKSNRYLLEAKCPNEIGDIHEGYTAMEVVCQHEIGPDTRDLLYELVLLGGKATDKCYEVLDCDYRMPFEHLTVLLLSGYYSTKGHYLFLDELAEGFENDDGGEDPIEILSILHKTVKVGDNLSCGDIDSTVINNINHLPLLEVGVTHSKGGPMEDLMGRFPIETLSNPSQPPQQLEGTAVVEAPIWFKERVCVQLKKNNVQAFIKYVNGSQAVVELKDNSTQTVCHEDVIMVPPQEHDMVIVTGGADVGVEGELVCIDGTDAILVENKEKFKLVNFAHLAKVSITDIEKSPKKDKVQEQNAPEKALVLNNQEEKEKYKEVPGNESTTGGKKCSVCKARKATAEFSKTQRGKGAAAKCKDCIASKQQATQKAQEIKKQKAEERNKLLAAVYNTIGARCSKCGIIKKKDEFKCTTDQWSTHRGPCKDCIAEQAERQRIAMEEEKTRRQPIIEKNQKSERLLYDQKKERYEQYKKEMEESGRSVETEMISSSDLVYVVTSVKVGYYPVTPNLHGIYTTCKGAQEGARRAFARESSSFRDGKFLPNDERIAKCDTTDFLVPGITFNSRVMFELFDEDARMGYTSVAVTAIPIDQTTSCTAKLPCLGASIERAPYLGKKINANPLLVGGTEIAAIFTHFDDGVFLAGVYTKRDDAIARGLTYAKFYDEEVEKEQIEDALAVSRGSLFRDEEYSEWEVAIETTFLDRDAYQGLGFRNREGCWIDPMVKGYD